MEKSLSRVSAESMKAAYDQVGTKPIAAREIQGWITRYGEAPRKVRIARIAANVSQQFVEDVGMETHNDLRHVTYAMCVEDCVVRKIDAELLVAQFGKPSKVAPKGVALPVRRGVRRPPSKVSLPLGKPAEGLVADDDDEDDLLLW